MIDRQRGSPFPSRILESPALSEATHGSERRQRETHRAQSLESLARFAGGVAHDLHNTLSAIVGFAERLSRTLPDRPNARQDAESIRDCAMQASALARQLFDLSHRSKPQAIALDLPNLVDKAERLLCQLIGDDVMLQKVTEPNVPAVMADPESIERVVINLAVNARQAMPRGGSLRVATRNVNAEEVARLVGAPAEGAWVDLSVADTGTGMTPETLARIFERRFTTRGDDGGSGLGLATARSLVEEARGHLVAESEVGVGTTVHVLLPRARAREAPPLAVEAPRLVHAEETLLVVDHDPFVRETTSRALRRAGYHVLSCGTAGEGLELLSSHRGRLDLLLLDLATTGPNGGDFAREATRIRPKLELLFLYGGGAEVATMGAPSRARPPLLTKPFSAKTLSRVVRDLLDGVGAGSCSDRSSALRC
jgi:two-component system, cell cycle sensor histidine kinase and response regulator CckA